MGIPVTGSVGDAGYPLLFAEVDARLAAAGIPEADGDASPTATTVLSAPSDWTFPDDTCWYVTAFVEGLPTDGPLPGKGRHQWLLKQNVRLACAHRLGCITEDDREQAQKLLDERFGWLVRNTAPRREPKRYECGGGVDFGVQRAATKTDEEARAELSGHEHNDWMTMANNAATGSQAAATGSQPNAGTNQAAAGNGQTAATGAPTKAPKAKAAKGAKTSPGGPKRLDDAHIGAYIADKYLKSRFLITRGLGWMEFDGKRWVSVADPVVGEAVRLGIIDLYSAEARAHVDPERLKRISGLFSASRIFAILRIAKGYLWTKDEEFDAHPDLLNVLNGVVNLRDGTLSSHDPALRFTKLCPHNYIPGAVHEDWTKALRALPDTDTVDWLQVRLGQSLAGYPTPDDVLVFMAGGGENGKTTIVDGIHESVGKEYAVTLPDRVLLANNGDHPTELMTLRGARLAFMEELPDQHLNIKRLKDTHGRGSLSARYCGKDTVEWAPTHTIFVTTNHIPRIDEPEHAVWRRLAMVKFPYRYRKPHEAIEGPMDRRGDAGLRERLRHPGSRRQHEAILAWLIKGAVLSYQNGMPEPPASVEAAKEAWRSSVDVLLRFAADTLVPDPGYHAMSTELYQNFAEWLKNNGHTAWSDQLFAARFEQHPRIEAKNITRKRIRKSAVGQRLSRSPKLWTGYPRTAPADKYLAWLGVRFRDPKDTFDPDGKNGW